MDTVVTNSSDTLDEFVQGNEDWSVFKFSQSPKMSTYLLCFVIGQYSVQSRQGVQRIF